MRAAGRRALVVAPLLGGAIVLGLARELERPASRLAAADRERVASGPAAELIAPRQPRPKHATAAPRPREVAARTPDALRLRTLVERLARDLRDEPFHGPTWDTRLAAHARPFDQATLVAGAGLVPELSDDELLLLAGLVAARQELDRTLVAEAPLRLRAGWRLELDAAERETDPHRLALALRAAAALGDADDASRLWSLATGDGPSAAAARRALERARQPRIAAELAARAAEPEEAWTLPLLQRLARRTGWAFDEGTRAATAARLARLVADEERETSHRSRAALALGAWSPREALLLAQAAPLERPLAEPLRVLLRSLAATGEARGAALLLAERVAAAETDEDPLRLAEDRVALGDVHVLHDGALLALLERETREADDDARRRRALRALVSAADPVSVTTLRAVATEDPDPAARGLAVRALAGDRTGLLERIAARDPHIDVRRLASRTLGADSR